MKSLLLTIRPFPLVPVSPSLRRSISAFPTRMSKHERSHSQEDALRHPSTKRAKEIDSENPYEQLVSTSEQRKVKPKTRNVLHWFRSKDLRAEDNAALSMASQQAQEAKTTLITAYLFSPADMDWHGTSPARTDFILESLRLLQEQLHEMHIPLVPIVAEKRTEKGAKILDFAKENDVSHIHANFEYEIDELRRDLDLFERLDKDDAGKDIAFDLYHDQTVAEPLTLTGGSGPIKVFTPYHKAWLAEVSAHPDMLDTYDLPTANNKSASSGKLKPLFSHSLPSLPDSKQFASKDEQSRIRKLWPAGHAAAVERLEHFMKKKAPHYAATRSNPAKDSSSRLSPYFASGVLSVREALSAAKKAVGSADFSESGSGDPGIASWVREIVFREFYRSMLVLKPHNALNLPQNLKFDFVQWEDDEEGWKKWCEGRTGVPFVDAGMRQLNTEAYMHNRLRMNTSSYLRTNLLIDYRKGERYFAEHLVDWDLSNNTQGWEPSYTVFNPVSQAERNDPEGEYIRKWVPELKDVQGKAVFDPFHRLDKGEFEKLGYPEPHVDWSETKERCMQRYKNDMAGVEP